MSNRNHNRNGLNNTTLRLDSVVASQPELGPSIPDGGYGWIIVFSTFILQILIPSIVSSYGIFLLYNRIESSLTSDELNLWDSALFSAPVIYAVFYTLSDPWSRTIVAASTWPRLVTTAGVFNICAGLVIQWFAMRKFLGIMVYMLAGMLTGFGSSLALTQAETLVSQYFRLKLLTVNNLLVCGYALGFITVPIALGFLIMRNGIQHSLLIYQIVILQCVVVVLTYRKPLYLKEYRRRYELLQNISEDDELLFSKDETEMSTNVTPAAQTSADISSSSSAPSADDPNILATTPSVHETNTSLTPPWRLEPFEPEVTTQPIFTGNNFSSNATYGFDNSVSNEICNDSTFIASPERIVVSNFRQEISLLWNLSFYKSLIFLVTVKCSYVVFWALFPTYLYTKMDKLHSQQATLLVGCLSLGSLLLGILASFLPAFGTSRQIVTSGFCVLGSMGYFVISDAENEGWLLFGALNIIISITALHMLHPSIIKLTLGFYYGKARTLLYTLTGISLLLFFIHDLSYRNCFRLLSLLHLITALLLILFNGLYSGLKRMCR